MKKKTKPTAQRTKYFSAYTDGLPTFKKRNISGVYLIYNRNKKVVYIGYSEKDVYKTLYRHFQSWNDKTQQRFTYNRSALVRLIITTPKRAALLEKYLIIKMKPKDNMVKYESYLSDSEEQRAKEIAVETEPMPAQDWKNISVPF